MSVLTKWQELSDKKAELEKELNALEQNENFKKEMAFKEDLEKLATEYGKSFEDIIDILSPDRKQEVANDKEVKTRKKRKLKIFKNPHTDEVIETRGGNHAQLKKWKAEHGSDTVESWIVNEVE